MRAYATYDPRKGTHVAGGNGGDHPYQEIPYGDGPGPRGPIPEVPQHYAQVPPPPQRQGMLAPGPLFLLFCLVPRRRFGSLHSSWYSQCPWMPISYGWCPQTQAGSLVKSVHDYIHTIFFSVVSFTDVRYSLQLVVLCLDRRRISLHMPLSTFWEWGRRWLSNSKEYFATFTIFIFLSLRQRTEWCQMEWLQMEWWRCRPPLDKDQAWPSQALLLTSDSKVI